MQKKIEYLLPAALEAVDQVLVNKYGRENIPAGYQSAISGFGTSLMQMGLLPTLAVYLDKDSSSKIKRPILLKALFTILASGASQFPAKGKLPEMVLEGESVKQADELLKSIASEAYQKDLKAHLLYAAQALKLAIRTYKLVDKHGKL